MFAGRLNCPAGGSERLCRSIENVERTKSNGKLPGVDVCPTFGKHFDMIGGISGADFARFHEQKPCF